MQARLATRNPAPASIAWPLTSSTIERITTQMNPPSHPQSVRRRLVYSGCPTIPIVLADRPAVGERYEVGWWSSAGQPAGDPCED